MAAVVVHKDLQGKVGTLKLDRHSIALLMMFQLQCFKTTGYGGYGYGGRSYGRYGKREAEPGYGRGGYGGYGRGGRYYG